MLENYKKILEEREESRRLAKRSREEDEDDDDDLNVGRNDLESESESENININSNNNNSTERWTQSDWSTLSLAFCILQQPFFLSSNTSTNTNTSTSSSSSFNNSSLSAGIKWNLASKVFDKPKSPIIIRRHGLKLFKSYKELAKMVEMDSLVRLIMKSSFNFQSDSNDLNQIFKNVFEAHVGYLIR